jgi:predicted TIM-barrel fold metal-dependent hydrolase
MIIDFHTHIFPAGMRSDRERYFSGEPAFQLLYQHPKAKMVGVEELVAMMDTEKISRTVVFGFPWKDPDRSRRHNDYILEAVDQYPSRLVGFGCMDLSDGRAAQEAERCIREGLAGIGELAFYESGIDDIGLDRLAPIMEIGLSYGVPVLIHTNEPVGHVYPGKTANTMSQIYDLVKTYPHNKIVLAHWGGGLFFFHLLKKEVKPVFENVFFDTAASPFLYDGDIYRLAVEIVGVEKILFGSDYPLIPPSRYFKEMAEAGLSQHQMDMICGANAEKLLGIQP